MVSLNPQKILAPSRPAGLAEFGGSPVDGFNSTLMRFVAHTVFVPDGMSAQDAADAAMAALASGKPRNEIEGMLIGQMVATHFAAIECFRRGALSEQTTEARAANLANASKLTRSFATLLQTLDRHRNGGNQTVRVEHVHVYSGGQAVVGPVSAGAMAAAPAGDPLAIEHASGASHAAPGDLAAIGAEARGEEGEK